MSGEGILFNKRPLNGCGRIEGTDGFTNDGQLTQSGSKRPRVGPQVLRGASNTALVERRSFLPSLPYLKHAVDGGQAEGRQEARAMTHQLRSARAGKALPVAS